MDDESSSRRLHYVQNHSVINNKKVLDVGCGGGLLSEALAAAGAHVTAIDMSEQALQIAKQHADEQQLDIDYQHCTIEHLAQQKATPFEVITCMEMLEHVPNPMSILQSCAELLTPGGMAFFSTINRNAKSYLNAIIGAEYILQLLPKGTHHYEKFIRPSELTQWANKACFTLRHLQGISYHPLKADFSLTRDVSVNYLACYQKQESHHET